VKPYQIIETIGSIDKCDVLLALTTDIIENTLVLKTRDLAQGNSDSKGIIQKQVSYFIVLGERYKPELVNQVISRLCRKWNFEQNPGYSEITMDKKTVSCIRIKNLTSLRKIITIQQALLHEGLTLGRYMVFEGNCLIKVFKTFKLVEISECLYRDFYDKEKYYIRLHHSLSRKTFELATHSVKQKVPGNFDAALGIIFRFTGAEFVIRIYDKDIATERSLMLQKLFYHELEHPKLSALSLSV
jgi:hypothetical protein